MKRMVAWILAMLMVCSLAGCGKTAEQPDQTAESVQVIAMDTVMRVTAYGENRSKAVAQAEEEIYRLEELFSRTREDSEIALLNQTAGERVNVGAEVCDLLRAAGEYAATTGGTFDVTIAPVVSAWGFTTDHQQIPTTEELKEKMAAVGMEHVHLDGETAMLDAGTQVDLGGIAKGYASDLGGKIFQEYNIPRGTIQLGGNVLAWGQRPDGQPWRIGIQDPKHPDDGNALAAVIALSDAFAVTSGSYQRFFEENGKQYHHIIDPATGYPAESGLTSVTVVADGKIGNGTMCDALSTALFVMGEERALEFWRSGAYDMELVLVTEDDRVVVTEGLRDALTEMEESGYTYEIVS